MELLKDIDRKVLTDYQQRLSQLNERPEVSTGNNSQIQTKYKYSSLLDPNNQKPTYYQQQYQQEYQNLQKENRSNSVKLSNANPFLAQNVIDQNISNSNKKKPLGGLSPNEYVNSKIQKQLELRNDFCNQDNSHHSSFERPRSKEKQQYIQQGRFQVPSVNIFAQNFEGNLNKNVDLVNRSSNDLYSSEQANYDTHLKSLQISSKLNSLIQRGMIAEKKRDEKIQLFENIISNNAQLEQEEIFHLLEQLEENNPNKNPLFNQTNFNDREYSIVQRLQNTQQDQNQKTNGSLDQSELDSIPVKLPTKSTLKDNQSTNRTSKLKSADSKSKLNSKKDKNSEKTKTKKNKNGTLSTIKESEMSSQPSQKDILKKKTKSISSLPLKTLKEVGPNSTKNINTQSNIAPATSNSIIKNQSLNKTKAVENNIQGATSVLDSNQQMLPEKSQQQIIQESEMIYRGFMAIVKNEQASHNSNAMEFLKQQMVDNQQFRDSTLIFLKQYITNKK